MSAKRTEEQKVFKATVKVKLGGEQYEIAPLVIRDSREWRAKFVELLGAYPTYVNVSTDDPEKFKEALEALLVASPDTVLDLFFEYAKDLPRETIETTTTDAEISDAFKEIIAFAFPLAQSPLEAMGKITQ